MKDFLYPGGFQLLGSIDDEMAAVQGLSAAATSSAERGSNLLDKNRGYIAGLAVSALFLLPSAASADTSDFQNGDVRRGMDLLVQFIDWMKFPVVIGIGGALRVHERRAQEYKTINANLKALSEQVGQAGSQGGGLFGPKPDQGKLEQLNATVKYFGTQKQMYDNQRLTSLTSAEVLREGAEGVGLGFLFESFRQIYAFTMDQTGKAVELMGGTDQSDLAYVEATRSLVSIAALALLYGVATWRFFNIQHPGGRIGAQEEAQMRRQQKGGNNQ